MLGFLLALDVESRSHLGWLQTRGEKVMSYWLFKISPPSAQDLLVQPSRVHIRLCTDIYFPGAGIATLWIFVPLCFYLGPQRPVSRVRGMPCVISDLHVSVHISEG